MCQSCYVEYGAPRIINGRTTSGADLIGAVYSFNDVGGNAHIVLDDWNLEEEHLHQCLDTIRANLFGVPPDALIAERRCIEHMLGMSLNERVSALALHDGYLKS